MGTWSESAIRPRIGRRQTTQEPPLWRHESQGPMSPVRLALPCAFSGPPSSSLINIAPKIQLVFRGTQPRGLSSPFSHYRYCICGPRMCCALRWATSHPVNWPAGSAGFVYVGFPVGGLQVGKSYWYVHRAMPHRLYVADAALVSLTALYPHQHATHPPHLPCHLLRLSSDKTFLC